MHIQNRSINSLGATLLPVTFTANASWEVAVDSENPWVLITYVQEQDGVMCSWLKSSPVLIVTGLQGMDNRRCLPLPPSIPPSPPLPLFVCVPYSAFQVDRSLKIYVKIDLWSGPILLLLCISPKEMEPGPDGDASMLLFFTALFAIANIWNQHRYASVER